MFLPCAKSLLFNKNDSQDPRLGESVTLTNGPNRQFVIQGYPDDEGIALNGGRIGAAEGPDKIREFLYKMTPPFSYTGSLSELIYDHGNLKTDLSLITKHEFALSSNLTFLAGEQKVISFGGGHDYGYPDGAAFCQRFISAKNPKPIVINFDAHLDVRPNTQSNHSGTPFYRLKNEFKNQFELVEIGLQPQCNSAYHWKWAQDEGIHLFSLRQIEESNWSCVWNNPVFKNLTPQTPVHISFDIDGLKHADAGGCSQSWPTGLALKECLEFLNQLYKLSSCVSLGIYEVAPKFDVNNNTSKAAALIAFNFMFQNKK